MNVRILSLVGAMAATSAFAGITFTNTAPFDGAGELVLGFMAGGGQGASDNLQVALGTEAAYAGWQDGQAHLVSELRAADLVTAYGSGWENRTDLSFGIVGYTTNGLSSSTAWFSKFETTVGTLSTPWTRTSNSLQTAEGPLLKALYLGMKHSSAPETTPGGKAVIMDKSIPSAPFDAAWGNKIGGPNAFKSPYPVVNFLNAMTVVASWTNPDGAATEVAVSDVWKLPSASGSAIGTNGTLMGVFGLDKTGKLWYASNAAAFTAVPEPSTYAAIFAGLTLVVVGYRRFSKKA
jgi:hypothetical protein